MSFLHPDYYFDLEAFEHKILFENSSYVWEALSKINSYFQSFPLGKIETEIPKGVYLIHPEKISIGKGTILEPGSYIQGPCIIGKECSIRHGAYIRGGVITGDKCVLGHTSEFKNSILLNEAHAPHFNYVGDSILGNRTNLGAGTICANLKLNKKPVVIYLKEKRIETGLRKLGAILGDEAQTGCHSVLNPGTLFGKKAMCYPGINIGGFVSSEKVVR